MKHQYLIASVLALSTLSLSVSAQEEPTPEQLAASATETRQAVFKLLAFNFGPINAMARGRMPFDAAVAEGNALRMATLATMIPEVLAARDTREFDVETEALPIIWDRFDEFQEKAANLKTAAETFAAVAARGDQAETAGAVRAFGSACGNCHETFRVDND